ncbi:SMI1/KNR4 family protein [Streptomyces sp. NPDC093544]|jgi:cell wall assembly regulator SMI1|uniref:SMI1/KNR4 family protein n=1 Tax=Streptomyces sp. NPDC093544 TaxID=3155200 RepID=UPI003412498C
MSQVDEVISAWERIVRWLEDHAPASAQALHPPATNGDIHRLNERLGFDIPDVLEAWLRMNNGSTAKDTTQPIPGGGVALIKHVDSGLFPSGMAFHGCDEIAREHDDYLHIARGMADEDYWKPAWLPVIALPDAPYGFILDAGQPKGTAPVLRFAEASYPKPHLPSLGDLLRPMADLLEHGEAPRTFPEHRRFTVTSGRLDW